MKDIPLTEINSILDDFTDTRSLSRLSIPCSSGDNKFNERFASEDHYIFSQRHVYENHESNRKISKGSSDIMYAILWERDTENPEIKSILCAIYVGGAIINTVILVPNKIEWLLNGTPLLSIMLRYHDVELRFYDMTTYESLPKISFILYNAILAPTTRRQLFKEGNSNVCKLDDGKFLVYGSGMGNSCDSTTLHKNAKAFNVNMFFPRGPFALKIPEAVMIHDDFIPEYVCKSLDCNHLFYGKTPRLYEDESCRGVLDIAIKKLKYYERIGDKVTIGSYNENEFIGEHRDGPLQGGTHSLILYHEEPIEGGEIVFGNQEIRPLRRRCLIFDVNALHHTKPVIAGRKSIIGCELRVKQITI